jgi:hypothetical protein
MRNFLWVVVCFAIGCGARASFSLPEDGYCNRSLEDFQRLLLQPESRIAFINEGGFMNSGVCWWHSRLQRNSVYMARFRPELPWPSDREAREIIRQIMDEKGPVVIPGFANFYDFTRAYRYVIQGQLEGWQKRDSLLKFAWIRGMRGSPEVAPAEMRRQMDRLYDAVEIRREIAFAKLQLPGPEAHAWLVVGMVRRADGYRLFIIDSNEPSQTSVYDFRDGDTRLRFDFWTGVPYLGYDGTIKKLKKNFLRACGHDLT